MSYFLPTFVQASLHPLLCPSPCFRRLCSLAAASFDFPLLSLGSGFSPLFPPPLCLYTLFDDFFVLQYTRFPPRL